MRSPVDPEDRERGRFYELLGAVPKPMNLPPVDHATINVKKRKYRSIFDREPQLDHEHEQLDHEHEQLDHEHEQLDHEHEPHVALSKVDRTIRVLFGPSALPGEGGPPDAA